MKRMKWKEGTGKRALSAMLVILLLSALFVSAANTAVQAAGLVDETVDASNLYSKYSWENYQLDFYVDLSWAWLPWHFFKNVGTGAMYILHYLGEIIWTFSNLLSVGTGYVVQEAYRLDFISEMADSIGKSIQILAGISKTGVSADGFYPGFLKIIILTVGIYVTYIGLIKRETSKAISAVTNMLLIFVLSTGFIVYAPDYIQKINEFSSDVSTGSLELGTKIIMSDTGEMGSDAVDKIRNSLFAIQIYKPWLLLQYGTTDEDAIGRERIESLVSVSPGANHGKDRIEATKKEIEEHENDNLTVTGVWKRLGMVLFIFLLNLVISIFVLFLTGMMILSQLMFIVFALFLPISFVLSMFPTYDGMAKKAVLKIFNIIMMRAGITLTVTVAFSLSAMIYGMSEDSPFFMTAFLQIVIFVGIWMELDKILGMMSLQDNTNGRRRGSFIRSMGRYSLMRNVFGKHRGARSAIQTLVTRKKDQSEKLLWEKEVVESGQRALKEKNEAQRISSAPRVRYEVVDTGPGQKVDATGEQLDRYRERHVEGGSERCKAAVRTPDLKRDERYGVVIDQEPDSSDTGKSVNRQKTEAGNERRTIGGTLKASRRTEHQVRWWIENGRALRERSVKRAYRGTTGIERMAKKRFLYKDRYSGWRPIKNVSIREDGIQNPATQSHAGRPEMDAERHRTQELGKNRSSDCFGQKPRPENAVRNERVKAAERSPKLSPHTEGNVVSTDQKIHVDPNRMEHYRNMERQEYRQPEWKEEKQSERAEFGSRNQEKMAGKEKRERNKVLSTGEEIQLTSHRKVMAEKSVEVEKTVRNQYEENAALKQKSEINTAGKHERPDRR